MNYIIYTLLEIQTLVIFYGFKGAGIAQDERRASSTQQLTSGICYKNSSCTTKYIRTKIYIEDELYNKIQKHRKESNISMDDYVNGKLTRMFDSINEHLKNLDNGGYEAGYGGTFDLLNSSDVAMGNTYIDRWNRNENKTFDKNKVLAWTFTFQEGVQNMDPRIKSRADIRILMRWNPGYDLDGQSGSFSEENCICNTDWKYGCMAVFNVDLGSWAKGSLFAHEFGHTLGVAAHDNDIYGYNTSLIMNSAVAPDARIWSPNAKKLIREQGEKYHDSCLMTVEYQQFYLKSGTLGKIHFVTYFVTFITFSLLIISR